MEHTQGGFLISKIKQIQGRILKMLTEYGIQEFNGAQGVSSLRFGKKILFPFTNYPVNL